MADNTIEKIEARLDADYAQCFPRSVGWEKAATHLLIAYDYEVRRDDIHTIDRMKYALMHTLRWGRDSPSQPFRGYPDDFDPKLFELCRFALWRGAEYTGIFGAFTSYHQKLVDVVQIDECHIEFTANPSWKAYDVLDSRLHFQSRSSSPDHVHTLKKIARELSRGFESLTSQEMTDWFPDFETCRNLLSRMSNLLREGFLLPSSWSFDGIPILKMRTFWKAVLTLGLIHLGVAYRLTGQKNVGMIQLLIKPRDALVDWIADCVGIDRQIVRRLVNLHTYDRSSKTPDIAITPFVLLGNGRLAASPWMLTNSSLERNFCAYVAREYPKLYGPTDRNLASHLASELVDIFKNAGFEAAHSLKFSFSGVKGDIDLLVWSQKESFVMAAELYWKIATGDFMEVLHGETTCMAKMRDQLPKYSKVLSAGAGEFVAKSFNLKTAPRIDNWSCGMVVRGFVGTPRIANEQFFLVPDSLLTREVAKHKSLRDICQWAKTKPFLPQEGRDFQMCPLEVTSPSGIKVTFWECEENRQCMP
ncbi:MAG: hypothetical protein NT028_06185 [candidate division Zixibacteria bacterium]|nr:hypothetical protein [candidate division Zixibacteria bacterium]